MAGSVPVNGVDEVLAGAALRSALAYDSSLADDRPRLERALLDVLPTSEVAVRILALAPECGVLEHLMARRPEEASADLQDRGGVRPDLATWVIRSWCLGLGLPLPAHHQEGTGQPLSKPAPSPFHTPRGHGTVGARPSAASVSASFVRALACGTTTILGVGGHDGYVVAAVDGVTGRPGPWRRLATPRSPLSRDLVFVTVDQPTGVAEALWTDAAGVLRRRVEMERAEDGIPIVSMDGEDLVLSLDKPEPRYPLAAMLSEDGTLLDLYWTRDRKEVLRSTVQRQGVGDSPTILPPVCHGTERLTALQAAEGAQTSHRLLATTDKGRVLVSRRELGADHYSSWTSTSPPVSFVSGATFWCPGPGDLVLFAVSNQGLILCVDIGDGLSTDWPWTSLGRASGLPMGGKCASVTTTSGLSGSAMYMVWDGSLWAATLAFRNRHPDIGTFQRVDVADEA